MRRRRRGAWPRLAQRPSLIGGLSGVRLTPDLRRRRACGLAERRQKESVGGRSGCKVPIALSPAPRPCARPASAAVGRGIESTAVSFCHRDFKVKSSTVPTRGEAAGYFGRVGNVPVALSPAVKHFARIRPRSGAPIALARRAHVEITPKLKWRPLVLLTPRALLMPRGDHVHNSKTRTYPKTTEVAARSLTGVWRMDGRLAVRALSPKRRTSDDRPVTLWTSSASRGGSVHGICSRSGLVLVIALRNCIWGWK
mmetsp:Transcript_64173/g.177387  ORF Transcript_64173/g.177387 Transcript_64173/m.177387 type:complete len:254 (-) Transcript_64173:41-802(-)